MPDLPRTLPMIQPGASNGSPPIFEKVAIVGLGLIGGSIALAVRQHWPSSLVIGVDRKEVLERTEIATGSVLWTGGRPFVGESPGGRHWTSHSSWMVSRPPVPTG